MKKLVLIDSNAIIHRSYHAIPKTFSSRKGERTNAVYGFTTTLIKVLEDLKPEYVVASFDVAKKTFRHEAYKEYKATRVAADQELYDQIPRVKELLQVLNIPIYEKEGFEADDVIGTIVKSCQTENSKCKVDGEKVAVYVVSGDKDVFQLVDGNIFVYILRKGLSDSQIVDRKTIKEQYNLDPEDFIDLKALAGDASDNIPGVPGIGPKTATTLIQQFDTLKNLYEKIGQSLEQTGLITNFQLLISNQFLNNKELNIKNSDLIENLKFKIKNLSNKDLGAVTTLLDIRPRILELLIKNYEQAFLSQSLATIHKDVPINFDIATCKWGDYDKEELKRFFEELSFHSLLKRFGVEPKEAAKTKEAKEQEKKDKQLKLL